MVDIYRDGAPVTPDSVLALTGAGLRDVLAERVRQIDEEGFTLAHDLGHPPVELAMGSIAYLGFAIDQLFGRHGLEEAGDPALRPDVWPWEGEAWRPGDARANLIKAGAILLATLDRIDGALADSGEADRG